VNRVNRVQKLKSRREETGKIRKLIKQERKSEIIEIKNKEININNQKQNKL
jgi:hypothetical protein